MIARLFFAVLMLSFASLAQAHKPSDAYLWLDVNTNEIQGRWDVALRDLDVVLALDTNHDNKLTWGEIRTRQTEINAYLLPHLSLMADSTACPLQFQDHAIDQHSDGTYLVLRFTAACAAATGFRVDYRLFEDIDPTHRGVTRVTFVAESAASASSLPLVLDPARGPVQVTPAGVQATNPAINTNAQQNAAPSLGHAGFLREGIHHILIGYDHILFLLCLLLPAVLTRQGTAMQGTWQPAPLRAAVWPLLRVVTAFTVAHSITLALAATGVVELSSSVIEPAIAVTIMLAALNNLWPVVTRRTAWITFAFGLIHGFGFASVLLDLGLPSGDFAWTLLQFNLGVEIGQLLVVGVALVPLYLLRQKRFYPIAVMGTGSVLGITLAAIWFAERVFDFKVLPI